MASAGHLVSEFEKSVTVLIAMIRPPQIRGSVPYRVCNCLCRYFLNLTETQVRGSA